jgi:hypothetical protein
MSKGIVLLAQNSEFDYVKQACLCAMSVKVTNPETNVSLVTNDEVPTKYKHLFDQIISIPWDVKTEGAEQFASSERWKIYHVTPYDETLVMDTDMLVLQDISNWWSFLKNYDLYFVSNVETYRGKVVKDTYYRKVFVENQLPNLYSGLHYFKKCNTAYTFYKWLELIIHNWPLFVEKHLQNYPPTSCSVDVAAALAAKILNCETEITNNKIRYPTFTHMKPYIQEWIRPKATWQSNVGVYLTADLKLTIGNHIQQGIFHYVEKDFASTDIISRYEKYLGIIND